MSFIKQRGRGNPPAERGGLGEVTAGYPFQRLRGQGVELVKIRKHYKYKFGTFCFTFYSLPVHVAAVLSLRQYHPLNQNYQAEQESRT